MPRWYNEVRSNPDISRLQLRLHEFFRLRDGLADGDLRVGFRMATKGWVVLDIGLDGTAVSIWAAYLFPPFRSLLYWLKAVDACEDPLVVEMNEEGCIKRLEVWETEDFERLVFVVRDQWDDAVHIQGVVRRDTLIRRFKTALFDFFQEGFDPVAWGTEGETLRRDILDEPWFADRT